MSGPSPRRDPYGSGQSPLPDGLQAFGAGTGENQQREQRAGGNARELPGQRRRAFIEHGDLED